MSMKIINPRFTAEEVEIIDNLIKAGRARSRADFVRNSTLKALWEIEHQLQELRATRTEKKE